MSLLNKRNTLSLINIKLETENISIKYAGFIWKAFC